ncbi:hypothetical protein E4S40_12160 [Algoriphagus kandeliae]|uniref:Uncharacterized protein n=1 Tax=Algoriphagus kandeliae TaxID=2562278 RepID=A0A4Y9QUB2_9BACT|nr:hypothetical protein [Algoriphagus kandeliae]TFV94756.1 hypothetical protein E4S40_12160 [Algoriphagus kandeliae]
MAHQVYKESQSYRGTWLMYLLLMTEIPMLILVFIILKTSKTDPNEIAFATAVIIGVVGLTFLLLMSIRLESRIDEVGIHYRYVPFINKWRTIPRSKIREIQVISYSPISDFGGWGIKGNRTTKAYSIIGDKGMTIHTDEKKKIMIGTQKAGELKAFLDYWQEETSYE